jgi:uncharacterized protein
MLIGRVRDIWRYPVKSMLGERLDSCTTGVSGILGDRGWALRDETSGEIRGAKYMPALMQCSASYQQQPAESRILDVDISLPDETHISSSDKDVNERLSRFLGRRVSLWPLQPADNKAHYRRKQAGSYLMSRIGRSRFVRPYIRDLIHYAGLDAPAREMFSREADEPLPDFSVIPPELFEFTTLPGTYFDAFPIHIVTTSSLNAMARFNPTARWDARRFRPNFLIETKDGIDGLIESEWSGRELQLGEVRLRCEIPAVRCGMTTHAQSDLPRDTTILRTIVRDAGQNFGVYANVICSGCVKVDDVVELL